MSHLQPGQIFYEDKARLISINEPAPLPETNLHVVSIREKNLVFKRIFDLVTSILVIVFVLSWLLPILALIIKIDSRGPVFFIQKRVGAMGKVFYCLKLRTMVVNEQANTQQALNNDPRITSFGKFLRVSCLDELPQFFNVLIGHMSIVGPRPHMIRDCKEFSKIVKHYNYRNLVKPGITGMAQVKGYRGKTNDYYDVSHRYKWDMFYVKNRSLNLDMRIMGLTIVSTFTALFTTLFASRDREQVVDFKLDSREYLN
ncbi:MAG TPA: sugar transferase [Flavisolibacter sp.]|nr:sugar transferase [Flavisolibacter sp.]